MRGKLSSEKETDESSSQALDLVKKTNKSVKQISDEVSNVVLGKEETIEMVMAGILANGNILFEDFPGLAKTLMSNTCLLYTSPSPRDLSTSRMPSSA